jgi:hypothetical protein
MHIPPMMRSCVHARVLYIIMALLNYIKKRALLF